MSAGELIAVPVVESFEEDVSWPVVANIIEEPPTLGTLLKGMACMICPVLRFQDHWAVLWGCPSTGASWNTHRCLLRPQWALHPWGYSRPHWESAQKMGGGELSLLVGHVKSSSCGDLDSRPHSHPETVLLPVDNFRYKETWLMGIRLLWHRSSVSQKNQYPF